jgi:hypothetical protein
VQLRVQIGEGNGSLVGVLRAMEAGSRPKGDCCVCGRMSWNWVILCTRKRRRARQGRVQAFLIFSGRR